MFLSPQDYSYLYDEFSNEVYYVVNSALYNSNDVESALQTYFNDFSVFLRKQGLSSQLVYFINLNNSVFVYSTYPKLTLQFSNGTSHIMAYNSTLTFKDLHFRYYVNDMNYTLTLNQPFEKYYMLKIT